MPTWPVTITISWLLYPAENNRCGPKEGDPFESAVDACVATLLELQLMLGPVKEDALLHERVSRAVRLMRTALEQLRVLAGPRESALGYGFVIPAPVAPEPDWE